MLTMILLFLLRAGLIFLLALNGVQANSTAVLFKAVTAQKKDYQAYLLSQPETLSFVDFFQKQKPPLQSELLERVSLARQKDLQGKTLEAKQLYIQSMDLFFTGGHWSERVLSLFIFSAGRLYQLEKNKAVWKRFLQKMLHLHPHWKKQFQHKDFAFLHTQTSKKQKQSLPMAFSWDFAKQFPLAEKILVNGIAFSSLSKESLSLLPGFYQFTLLSNTFHPIQAFLHTKDLPSWKPQWVPFLKGTCTRPTFHYASLKISPQKQRWFFHLACVKSLAQTIHLETHLNPSSSWDVSLRQDVQFPPVDFALQKDSLPLKQTLFTSSLKKDFSPKDVHTVQDKKWLWGLGILGAGFLFFNLKGKTVRLSLPF